MMMVDMNNRWIYKGSVTTPPCKQNVYWNVLRTVYPIKQKHLDQFKNQLKRDNLDVIGNYRLIQDLTPHHNPRIITTSIGEPKPVQKKQSWGLYITIVIQAVVILILVFLSKCAQDNTTAALEKIKGVEMKA